MSYELWSLYVNKELTKTISDKVLQIYQFDLFDRILSFFLSF